MRIAKLATTALLVWAASTAEAANLIYNGDLDFTVPVLVSPGYSVPKPEGWVNNNIIAGVGATNDGLSSEPWAGPSPTPVTTNGSGLPAPDGCGGLDCGVFFKPFIGNQSTGETISIHLYQDVAITGGLSYTLKAWVGVESNYTAGETALRMLWFDSSDGFLGGPSLDLIAEGLMTPNGQAFNYKQFTIVGLAPANAAYARVLLSSIDGYANPQGGGQALVADDFSLEQTGGQVPEPATSALIGLGLAVIGYARRRSVR